MFSDIVTKDILNNQNEQFPTRVGFGEGLAQAGTEDSNIYGLCADLTESTYMHLFAERFPDRFVQVGVAEQNLVTVASGLSAMGKLPFVSSYAMFSPGRNWEQIRTTICYNDTPVIIVGNHTGISVGPDGGTHQALEDIALMSVLPNMVVVSPCDRNQAYQATLALARLRKPAYLRLTREKTPTIVASNALFEIGVAQELYRSQGSYRHIVGIVVTGVITYQVLQSVSLLESQNIGCIVLNIHTIKPLDVDAILHLAKEVQGIVVVEEHQVVGGLGSLVAQFLATTYPVPMRFVGVDNRFGQSGTPEQLYTEYQLDSATIIKKVVSLFQK